MSGLIYIENPEPIASITGSGSTNRLPLWTGTFTLSNSALYQLGTLIGINVAVPTAGLSLPAGTTAAASLNFATGVAPTTPNVGDVWFDGTDLKARNGAGTQTLAYVGGPGVGTVTAVTATAPLASTGGTTPDISLGTVGTAKGGTGLTTTPTNGQLLIGNGAGYALATLTAGTGVTIVNGAGTVTISAPDTGTVTGTGTAGAIPRWIGTTPATALGDSLLSQSGTLVTNSGTFLADNGSQAAPAYSFTSSPGTGMFCASTDPFLRFAVTGTYRVVVTSFGEVGINTNTPREMLHVSGGSVKVGANANDSFLSFGDESTTVRNVGVYRGAGATALSLGGYGGITFHASATTLGSQAEQMRITATGLVGIGTTGPSSKLHVAAGDIRFDNAYGIIGATNTAGYVLRGDGTRFVPAQLQYSDLGGTPSIPTVSGTASYVARFTGTNAVGNGVAYDDNSTFQVGNFATFTGVKFHAKGLSVTTGANQASTFNPLLVKQALLNIVSGDVSNENNMAAVGLLTTSMGVTTTRGSEVYLAASRSTSTQLAAGTFTALQSGDRSGSIYFGGDNGVNVRSYGALIEAAAQSTWSSANAQSVLRFYLAPSGVSYASTVAMEITATSVYLPTANLGVGVSPSYKIDATATESAVLRLRRQATATTGHALILDGYGAYSTSYAGIEFRANSIRVASIAQESSGSLYVDFNDNGGSGSLYFRSNTNIQVQITSTGNLLIGTTSNPNSYRQVNAGDIALYTTNDTTGVTTLRLGSSVSMPQGIATVAGTKTAVGAGYLTLSTATGGTAVERMRIDSAGNVGVGVSPSAWSGYLALQIGGSAALWAVASGGNDAWLTSNGYWDGTNFRYIASAPALAYSIGAPGHRWMYAATGVAGNTFSLTTGMILDNSGNVGVGTAGPGSIVDVLRTVDNTTNLRVRNLSATPAAQARLDVVSDAGTLVAGIVSSAWTSFGLANGDGYLWNLANRSLSFGTNGTERARIDSAGNLLPGVDNTQTLGSSAKRWGAIYAGALITDATVTDPSTSGTSYTYTLTMGQAGTFTATKSVATATAVQFFAVDVPNGAHSFDVTFVVSESGFSVAKKYTVVAQYGTTAATITAFKLVDTGPYSGADITVTFARDGVPSGTRVICLVQHAFGSNVNVAMTLSVAASTGSTSVAIF